MPTCCRPGADTRCSRIAAERGRVHGHENLYFIDAAAHVTNACVNPVLTVMALSLRNAEALARAHGA
jgi:choline dehydrogenase-like flavoprotein